MIHTINALSGKPYSKLEKLEENLTSLEERIKQLQKDIAKHEAEIKRLQEKLK